MKTILQNIANILMLNVHNIDSPGILEGKMGIVLFFYHYGRYSQNSIYSEIADELLDSVLDNVNKLPDLSFDQGAIGIAWGVRYLIRNGFIEGDPKEILSEVENILLMNYTNDLRSKIPISAIGLYLRSMIQDGSKIDEYERLINWGLKKYELYFLCLSNNAKSISYINSSLLLLSTLEKHAKYEAWVKKIIFKIVLYVSNIESLNNSDIYDVTILYKILVSLRSSSEDQKIIINKLKAICNTPYKNIPIEHLWQNILFFPDEKIFLNLHEVNNYLGDNYLFSPDIQSLFLYKGLAGIGLALIKSNNI